MARHSKLRSQARDFLVSRNFWWLTAGVFGVARIATWLFPFDSDHWIFFYVGKHWFDGKELYLQVWDHKSPVIFAINGLMSKVFGDSLVLHRIFLTAVTALGIWLFYLVSLRLFAELRRKSAVLDARIATILFSFWVNLSQFTNSGNDTEAFGVIALLAAAYCYLRFRSDHQWKWLLYSGIGVSFLVFLKVNFSLLMLPFIVEFCRTYAKQWRRFFGYGVIWALPTGLQFLAWYSYFEPRNLFGEFWIAMIGFNSKYAKVGWTGGLSSNLLSFLMILGIAALFFAGAHWFAWKKRSVEKNGMLLLLAGVALFFSGVSGTFYSHYFLIIIPYLCIVAAAYWREIVRARPLLTLAVVGVLGSFAISCKQLYNSFYGAAAADARNMSAAARYVEARTTNADTIIFDGYGATFYQLAHRDSGSRFISASHPLIDSRENFGYGLTRKYVGDMAISQPKYVVIDMATAAIYAENTDATRYFANHYERETTLPGYEIWRRKQ